MERIYLRAQDQRTIQYPWGTITWVAGGELGNADKLTVGRVVIDVGQSNARHAHSNCEEVLYLLQGRLEHTAGDESYTLNPGDTITIAPGVWHNATCLGTQEAVMLVSYSSAYRKMMNE